VAALPASSAAGANAPAAASLNSSPPAYVPRDRDGLDLELKLALLAQSNCFTAHKRRACCGSETSAKSLACIGGRPF
jgi:hypothetical protein